MVSTTAVAVATPESLAKSKHGLHTPADANYLEGLKTQELNMIRKLAGNDPLVRKRTMRRLRKWLSAIAFKIPDSPDSRDVVDPNFIRVWKALFYCMWMADKPLPQEQLAEQISSLITIFSSKPNIMMFFVDWFFLTVSREWPWIDRFRLDKFMMLIRRFLRKSLEQLSLKNWDQKLLTQFTQIISVHIFNRQKPVSRKTRSRAKIPDLPKAPLGFQIHFTDIFLEELAKVGANTLKSNDTIQIISPFIYELAYNDDDRLLSEIRERIFDYLVQQSDAAFDYLESAEDPSDEDEDDSDVSADMMNVDDDEEASKDLENDESDEEELDYNQPLDPRAGQVDVVLPQIEVSYGDLALKLVESGGQKDVKKKNKKILYALARDLNEVTAGIYPLALPDLGPRNPAIKKKEVQMAAERLVALETELCNDKPGRKNKKMRKRELKQMLNGDADASPPKPLKKKKTEDMKKKETEDMKKKETEGMKKKNKKILHALARDLDEVTAGKHPLALPDPGPGNPTIKKNEVQMAAEPLVALETELCSDKPGRKNKKERKRELKQMLNGVADASPPKPLKKKKTEDMKKRVSFVLAKNLEHPHSDYQDSIQRSPAIPYDSRKQPNFGLLKPLKI